MDVNEFNNLDIPRKAKWAPGYAALNWGFALMMILVAMGGAAAVIAHDGPKDVIFFVTMALVATLPTGIVAISSRQELRLISTGRMVEAKVVEIVTSRLNDAIVTFATEMGEITTKVLARSSRVGDTILVVYNPLSPREAIRFDDDRYVVS